MVRRCTIWMGLAKQAVFGFPSRAWLAIMGTARGRKHMWDPFRVSMDLVPGPEGQLDMSLLTESDRVRIIAALGLGLLRSDGIDQQGMDLLLKLSDPEARIWVQK